MSDFEGPASKAYAIALTSAFSCLASELSKKGLIDAYDLATNIQSSAAKHRESGGIAVADHMHNLSEYFLKMMRDAPPTKGQP